jgi:hypothetical protein
MEPSDYYDTPIKKVVHFIRSVGLIKDESKWEEQQITEGHGARAGLSWPTFYAFIHSFKFFRKINIFRDVISCSLVEVLRHYR